MAAIDQYSGQHTNGKWVISEMGFRGTAFCTIAAVDSPFTGNEGFKGDVSIASNTYDVFETPQIPVPIGDDVVLATGCIYKDGAITGRTNLFHYGYMWHRYTDDKGIERHEKEGFSELITSPAIHNSNPSIHILSRDNRFFNRGNMYNAISFRVEVRASEDFDGLMGFRVWACGTEQEMSRWNIVIRSDPQFKKPEKTVKWSAL